MKKVIAGLLMLGMLSWTVPAQARLPRTDEEIGTALAVAAPFLLTQILGAAVKTSAAGAAFEIGAIGGVALAMGTGMFLEHRSQKRLDRLGLYRYNGQASAVGEDRKWESDPEHPGMKRLKGYQNQS